MTERLALGGMAVSVAAVGAAYGSALAVGEPPGWAPVAMVVGNAGSVVALMVLAAARGGRVGRLAVPFATVFLVLVGGFGAVLAMPASGGAANPPELWLGLPPRAAVVLYGVGLLTLLVVPVAYAVTFDELALTDEDWSRIRRRAAGLEEGGRADGEGRAGPRSGDAAAGRRAAAGGGNGPGPDGGGGEDV